ncbi:Uncharacterised protein [Vibrio parahaemolyticus]|nr:Uncharacterised protein [Vibrio parahaemolyticus]
MSDWIDKSVEKQHSELERCINNEERNEVMAFKRKLLML